MGQENKSLVAKIDPKNELLLVDQQKQVYINTTNQKYYVKNHLFMQDIADVEHELNIFNFRRINQKYIVTVDYCSGTFKRGFCTTSNTINYFIQKQEYTLFQKTQMIVKQGLKLLLHVLKGFEILYKQFGYFTPNSKLVFFNKAHEVKVWINENLKITQNLQSPHCPQSLVLQNNLIREVIRLFDALRDPSLLLFRYSQNLPNHLLTFNVVFDIFKRKLEQLQNEDRIALKNLIEMHQRPTVKPAGITLPVQNISQQNSPLHSPRSLVPNIWFEHKNPLYNLTKRQFPRINVPTNIQQFKEAVTNSLQNTNNRYASPIQRFNLQKEIRSTMPPSVRNSRVHERILSTQVPSPTGFKRSELNQFKCHQEALKIKAVQRYSEAEPTSFGRRLSHTPLTDTVSFIKLDNLSKQSQQQMKPRKIVFESIMEAVPTNNDFQVHKRHRTDVKLLENNINSNKTNFNQKSAVDGTNLVNFNINTIKSIHLLDQNEDTDSDIIVDLKQIINKHKQRNRSDFP